MTAERSITIAQAQLVREYAIEGIEGTNAALSGCIFADGRLVLASGPYLVRVAPESGRVVDQFETFPEGRGLAWDGERLWQRSRGHFQRLDLRVAAVDRSCVLPLEDVTGLACFEGDLLALHAGGRRLARLRIVERALSPSSEVNVLGDAEVRGPLAGLAMAGAELWSLASNALVRLDTTTAEELERMTLPASMGPCDLAVDEQRRFYCVDGTSRRVRVFVEPAAGGGEAVPRWARQPASARVTDVSRPQHEVTARSETESPESTAMTAFARILVPVDFSSSSRRALATALFFQERLGSEVHLFRLGEQGGNAEFLAASGANVSYGGLERDARDRVLRFVENVFPGRSSRVSVHTAIGSDLVVGIERAAREVRATLVLLAGRRKQTLFRTPIERIARDLEGAVMVLWEDGASPQAGPS